MNKKEELNEEELNKIAGGKNESNGSKKGKTLYKCDFCGEVFDNKKDLKRHMENLHHVN